MSLVANTLRVRTHLPTSRIAGLKAAPLEITMHAPVATFGGHPSFVAVAWEEDASSRADISFLMTTTAQVVPEIVPVPADRGKLRYIRRTSDTYPRPTWSIHEFPKKGEWRPSASTIEIWGRIRIVVNGRDMTFFRGVPATINRYSSNEPFGDADAELFFPQITPWEPIQDVIPRWAQVELQRVGVNEDGEFLWTNQWCGEVIDYAYSEGGWTIQMRGAFYAVDDILKKPVFKHETIDIMDLIGDPIAGQTWVHNLNLGRIPWFLTGIKMRSRGAYEKMVTGWTQDILGNSQLRGDSYERYTIECKDRAPVMRLKSRTRNWHMVVGQPGLKISVDQDLTAATNAVYGEGVNKDNGRWRNSKFPRLHTDTAPLWPGVDYHIGDTNANIQAFKHSLIVCGFGGNGHTLRDDATYHSDEVRAIEDFQRQCGLNVESTIGAQSWNAAFNPGQNSGVLDLAYIGALHWMPHVEPWLYNADGDIIGVNPFYDPSIGPRVEKYYNYGDGVERAEGQESAIRRIDIDWMGYDSDGNNVNGGYQTQESPGNWSGTITLQSDPQEGSRFDIRAGQNIVIKSFQGKTSNDLRFHIARAEHDVTNLTTTLTVDTQDRDLVEVAALIQRDREAAEDPASKLKYGRQRSGSVTEDVNSVFDVEAQCGVVPIHGTEARKWNVIRIPMGDFGQIARSEFHVTTAAEFSIAVFSKHVNPVMLSGLGNPDETDYWDNTLLDDWGLLVSWGGDGQMGGYWPGTSDDALTGVMKDNSGWNFRSFEPPWVYVATWCQTNNFILGQFFLEDSLAQS